MPVCTKCKQYKDENHFSPDKQKVNGLKSWCKECKNKHLREYRAHKRKTDREWVKQTNKNLREYFKKNPDKTKNYD